MTLRLAGWTLGMLLSLSACASVLGGWHEFCQRTRLDWYRMHAWPQPFTDIDRLATCAPFVTMAENGWVQQCTLTGFHFDPSTNELTEAGRLKIQSILFEHPEEFRKIYVVRGFRQEQSEKRIASVRDTLTRMVEGDSIPDVQLTAIEPRGVSAEEVQAISDRLRATVPDPRLPPAMGPTNGTP